MPRKPSVPLPPDQEILETLRRQNRPLKLDSLSRLLGIKGKKSLLDAMGRLAEQGFAARLPGGRWLPMEMAETMTGAFHFSQNGGVFISDDGKEFETLASHTCGAWDKDHVQAIHIPGQDNATIIKIIQRIQKEVPAVVKKRQGNVISLESIGKRTPVEFILNIVGKAPKDLVAGAIAAVIPEKQLAPNIWQAKLARVFENPDSVATQEAIVKLNHQVPGEFPALALAQAEKLPHAPTDKDFQNREDWRSLPFVTIDGADARDFDDAIHVEKNGDVWILRVAIADVSHYVLPDNDPASLDGEALKRGNSWYFPRSVEPMLPKALSNGLCSLKPGENRLAMLAEMRITSSGQPMPPRFAPIVMRSAARLTYDQTAQFFSGEEAAIPDKNIQAMLTEALVLYHHLADKRAERGTLDFILPEPAYHFNNEGALESITDADRNDAHRMIEEFMIAANEAVAWQLGEDNLPFLYRDHPEPDQVKLDSLYHSLKTTAMEILPPGLKREDLLNPKILRQILEASKGSSLEYVVNRLCLRSMSQARYLPENTGHYGLASVAYCHFTSPIRRYADLLVHRVLKASLGLSDKKALPVSENLSGIARQLNGREREALECERDIARRLGCIYLSKKIGAKLKGTVSAVTSFGLFVEFADMPAEGLIRVSSLGQDWFEYDSASQTLIGQNTGKVWRLGQPVEVIIQNVDMERLETRLELADNFPGQPRQKNRRNKSSHIHHFSFEKTPAKKNSGQAEGAVTGKRRKDKKPDDYRGKTPATKIPRQKKKWRKDSSII